MKYELLDGWEAIGDSVYRAKSAGGEVCHRVARSQPLETRQNLAKFIALAPQLLVTLERLSLACLPVRQGKRNGEAFGGLSLLDDEARALIEQAREYVS